jgi:hypothetical protein
MVDCGLSLSEQSNERCAVLYVGSLLSKLKTAVEYWRAVCVYTHKPFVIAVVGNADGQTFLAQSPYVFYEGEKCKVVGTTIHNSIDGTNGSNGLCVYPLEYWHAICVYTSHSFVRIAVVDSADVLLILFSIQNPAAFSQK